MGRSAKDVGDILARVAGERRGAGTLIGLAGRGIQASRSPIMHEREGARLGIPYRYVLIDFDPLGLEDGDVGAVVEAAAGLGFAGLNITHPLKQVVMPHLDRLAAEAEEIGAVNTVVLREGKSVGHNTDSWGFARGLASAMPEIRPGSVTQFGAGGAGAAVTHALLGLGAERIRIVDQNRERAEDLAERLATGAARVEVAEDAAEAVGGADGIVNATPVGMEKYPGTPFSTRLLSQEQWVADIVYLPPQTALLREAAARGCKVVPGTGMAVYQAVRAFELFTGLEADAQAMTAHFGAAA